MTLTSASIPPLKIEIGMKVFKRINACASLKFSSNPLPLQQYHKLITMSNIEALDNSLIIQSISFLIILQLSSNARTNLRRQQRDDSDMNSLCQFSNIFTR